MPSVNKPLLRDFDHGLAKSLGVVALFMVDKTQGAVVDVVTGLTFALGSGVTIVDTPEGAAMHFSGAQEFDVQHPAVTGEDPSAFVCVARIRATAQQGADPGCIFGTCNSSVDQGSFGVGWDSSATPKVGATWLTANGAGSVNTITTALNRFDTVFSHGQGGSGSNPAWVNGVLVGSATVSGTPTFPTRICFGGQNRASGALRFATGDLLWAALIKRPGFAAVFDTRITSGEVWQLYATDFPYSLFRKTRRPWKVAAGGNPTFTIAGVGAQALLSAASIASSGLGAVTVKAAASLSSIGLGALAALSASRISMAGTGALAALAASALSSAGIGAFNAVPGSIFPTFSIAGVSAPTLKAAMKFSPSGLGAFSPQVGGGVTFAFAGSCTTVFLGPGWRQPAATANIWTIRPPVSQSWSAASPPSNLWTHIL